MKTIRFMSAVRSCTVTGCAFNRALDCTANGVTIGEAAHPRCLSSVAGAQASRGECIKAGVGACKMNGCTHNRQLCCEARGVNVGIRDGRATCMTYRDVALRKARAAML